VAYGAVRTTEGVAPMRFEYDTEVNRGSISMGQLKDNLNKRGKDGWRLSQAFVQEGNTILIFERQMK
jgi:hypothetical protein